MSENLILDHIVNITEHRDLEILEISLMQTIFEVIPCRKVFMLRYNMEQEKLLCSACFDITGLNNSCIESCIDKTLVMEMIKEVSETGKLRAYADKGGYIICPVSLTGKNRTFIEVESSSYSESDIRVLESLTKIYHNYVSLLVDNQRDTLTGLLNRKTFDDKIMKLVEVKKGETPAGDYINERRRHNTKRFWLGMYDIDFFKKINDSYGHVFGDEVLIIISQLITEFFRADDLKFRFGGEEFITVIIADSTRDAYEVFERFRKTVASHKFPQIGKVTVSIGIVEITGYEMSTAFVGSADKALYYAKEHGRDMTCVYSELVKDGLLSSDIHKGGIIIFDQ